METIAIRKKEVLVLTGGASFRMKDRTEIGDIKKGLETGALVKERGAMESRQGSFKGRRIILGADNKGIRIMIGMEVRMEDRGDSNKVDFLEEEGLEDMKEEERGIRELEEIVMVEISRGMIGRKTRATIEEGDLTEVA